MGEAWPEGLWFACGRAKEWAAGEEVVLKVHVGCPGEL